MEIKIRIKTPKGNATSIEKKLRTIVIGKRRVKSNVYASADDDEILWEVEGSVRDVKKITRNLTGFDQIVQLIFSRKWVKKMAINKLSPEGQKELRDVLENHTNIEIVKRATANELVEANKTFWTKLKERFNKKE